MTAGCRSSFGCHIAHSDVAPGFRIRELNGGGRWASPCFLVVCFCSCMLTVICEPWRMVVVCFVIGRVWCGVVMLCRCRVQWWWGRGFERRSQVVVGGGGRRWLLVVEVTERMWVVIAVDGGWEGNCLFVGVMYGLFSANAAYAAQYKDTIVAYMIY